MYDYRELFQEINASIKQVNDGLLLIGEHLIQQNKAIRAVLDRLYYNETEVS